jgi:hypothetical protein
LSDKQDAISSRDAERGGAPTQSRIAIITILMIAADIAGSPSLLSPNPWCARARAFALSCLLLLCRS